MSLYKFLLADRVGAFSGVRWPAPGEWLEASEPLKECRNGVHACRAHDLPYWLGEELWEVELDGGVQSASYKLLARRGRLRERVEGWDEDSRNAFGQACVRRVVEHAAASLRAAGLDEQAALLETAGDVPDAAAAAAEVAISRSARAAAMLAQYVGDAAESLASEPVAVVAYVAAHAADLHLSMADVDGFAGEREAQAGWLIERLGLVG
jgi:hypothetical protein